MPKLQTLELEIKQSISNSRSNSLEKLAQQLETLRNVVSGDYKGLKEVADGVGYLAESTEKIQNAPNNVKKLAGALESLIKKSAGSENAAKGLWQVAVSLEKIADASERVQAVKSAMQNLRGAIVKPSDIMNLKKVQEAETKTAGEQPVSELPDNKAYLKSIDYAEQKTNHFSNAIHKAISAGKSLVGLGWDKLKSKISGLIGPVTNLIHSFGRIAMYRVLRSAIKAITQGFSEGIKHLYHWSAIVGNEFKNSMDSLTTSAHYLRDSLGAMASPLIDALAPAVEFLVEKFVSLLNVINQFIATITGQDSWRRAVRTATEYDDGIKDATDSAKKATEAQKKLNKALQDFDELNLITTSTTKGTNPSGGSGGSGSGIDSTHFVEEPIADWIKDIKKAIENGDWYGAGKLFADKMNSIVENWDAKAWGKKLGEKVENGLKLYLGFMENFDWSQFGIKSADFINGLLSKIDPEDLGKALVAHLKAALKYLASFTWTVDLSPLGTALGVAFNELFSEETMNDLGHTISGLVNKAIEVGVGFITTADFGTAAENIMDGLFTAISEINWVDAAKVVAKLATGLLDAIKSALEYAVTHIDVVLQAVWDFVGTLLSELWNYLVDGIGGLLKEFWQYVKENFWESGKDDGNGRKDGPVNSSTTGLGAGTEPTTSSYTQKVNVLYESNAKKIKDEITMFNKMNAKPKVTMTTKNFTATKDSIKKITGNRTVLIYAKKDKDSFNAVTKALNKITIDRTATIKFKPVIEVSDKSTGGLSKTIASEAQHKKLRDLRAEGGFPAQGSMFVAGEVPGQAEMVGNINGKTGVASGKEITGIADAVRDTGQTEAELLREQNRLLRQILTKSGTVTLTPSAAAGRWVSQSQAAYVRATGG